MAPVFLVDVCPALSRRVDDSPARPEAAAHLLHGNLRRLSFGRDGLTATPDAAIASYADLVGYLNRLNAEWTAAARRLSPRVLIELLDFTSGPVHAFFRSLDPDALALSSVAWAGEGASPNWFDIGREYTERWLHQQQIREAVGAAGLTARRWLHPTLDSFVRALPFKGLDPESARRGIRIEGDPRLGDPVLGTLAVMA